MPVCAAAAPYLTSVASEVIVTQDGVGESPAQTADELKARITRRDQPVGVMGLGVAGLYQAMELLAAGFKVVGYDHDPAVLDDIALGKVKATDIPVDDLAGALRAGRLTLIKGAGSLGQCAVVLIAVPTTLDASDRPDTSCVASAITAIADSVKPPVLIIMKSTAYPGMTRRLALEPLSSRLGQVGADWFLAYVPERGDPGNRRLAETLTTPRVVAGASPACRELAAELYRNIGSFICPASCLEAAEIAKLHENVYRFVNISYANELDAYCTALGLSTAEVIALAATKPFGFTPFQPGVGVGGMYIPVTPYYLADAAAAAGVPLATVKAALEVNKDRPAVLAESITRALPGPLRGSNLLVLGVAYKPNSKDCRNSAALRLCAELRDRGGRVRVVEPMLDGRTEFGGFPLVPFDDHQVKWADAVLEVVRHDAFADISSRLDGKLLITM